jgi:hypothetical protein
VVIIGLRMFSISSSETSALNTAFFIVTDVKTSNQVRFEVFTAVTMKNGVFWDVTSCGSCKNRRFRGT